MFIKAIMIPSELNSKVQTSKYIIEERENLEYSCIHSDETLIKAGRVHLALIGWLSNHGIKEFFDLTCLKRGLWLLYNFFYSTFENIVVTIFQRTDRGGGTLCTPLQACPFWK